MIALSSITDLPERCDVAVIGAGPAGLSAATLCADSGMQTLLLDENDSLGGQIYRAITTTPLKQHDVLGEDYWRGEAIGAAFQGSPSRYLPRATVWQLSPDGQIGVSRDGRARLIDARHVIIATGALERPMPIEGWTLPGVLTAGAAQILLKSSGLVAQGRTILAGSGPLLWLLAGQYAAAGRPIDTILDTTPRTNWTSALLHAPVFTTTRNFRKGLALIAKVRRATRVIGGVNAITAEGEGQLARVRYRVNRSWNTLEAHTLFLHQGVVPNINLPSAAGCTLEWDIVQACFRPVVDEWMRSSVERISIAGDAAGIGGADAAMPRGELAALDALYALGTLNAVERTRRAARSRIALAKAERGRGFLDRLYRPHKSFRLASDAAVVCRCEEITGAQVREAIGLGCVGPNQLKSFVRCGMGPCQGRFCGLTVSEMIAEARGTTPGEVGYYRLRPPVKPITVGEIASLPHEEADVRAVVRL